jgi:hypothetical protein
MNARVYGEKHISVMTHIPNVRLKDLDEYVLSISFVWLILV